MRICGQLSASEKVVTRCTLRSFVTPGAGPEAGPFGGTATAIARRDPVSVIGSSPAMDMLFIGQNIWSAILIFLFLLAVRNHFRIK